MKSLNKALINVYAINLNQDQYIIFHKFKNFFLRRKEYHEKFGVNVGYGKVILFSARSGVI